MTKTESSIITERINEDTASLTCTMTNFMSMLEKKINELMDQINKKNSKINDILREMQELKNLNRSLKSEVHKQSENLTTGVNHLISRSNTSIILVTVIKTTSAKWYFLKCLRESRKRSVTSKMSGRNVGGSCLRNSQKDLSHNFYKTLT